MVLSGSPSDRIRIAALGVHGRGRDHIVGFMKVPDVEVALLCDPDENVLVSRARSFEVHYGRIVYHGVQLRSSKALQHAVGLLREGIIGKVELAKGLVYRNRPGIGKKPDAPVPPGLHYDFWVGPAHMSPY